MKVYESIVTYVPFIYIFILSSIFGTIYHNDKLVLYQPYIILVFILINSVVYYITCEIRYFTNIIHTHVWRAVVVGMYGILVNNIHLELMVNFHIESKWTNSVVSFLYMVGVLVTRYVTKNKYYTTMVHIVFLFFPLARVWQVNLHMYVIYLCFSIVIVFSRIKVDDIKNGTLPLLPLIYYFMYLRVSNTFVVLGLLQLFFDVYTVKLEDYHAAHEISRLINEERKT